METIFKVGDVVYDNTMTESKGRVINIDLINSFPIKVEFEGCRNESYTLDGRLAKDLPKTLSFTPYKIEVNQERPIELPEVGEEIMVSDRGTSWFIRKFKSYREGVEYPVYVEDDNNCYKYFKRLR